MLTETPSTAASGKVERRLWQRWAGIAVWTPGQLSDGLLDLIEPLAGPDVRLDGPSDEIARLERLVGNFQGIGVAVGSLSGLRVPDQSRAALPFP